MDCVGQLLLLRYTVTQKYKVRLQISLSHWHTEIFTVYQLRITNELLDLHLTVKDTIQYYQDVLKTGTYFHRNRVLLFWYFMFFCCIRIHRNCLFHLLLLLQ